MHILITGGAGFIGTHLTHALLERGDRVSVLDNLSTGSIDNIKAVSRHPLYSFAIDDLSNALVLDRLASQADRKNTNSERNTGCLAKRRQRAPSNS